MLCATESTNRRPFKGRLAVGGVYKKGSTLASPPHLAGFRHKVTPPKTGGEFWLLLNLIDLHVESELKTGYNKLDTLGLRFQVQGLRFKASSSIIR